GARGRRRAWASGGRAVGAAGPVRPVSSGYCVDSGCTSWADDSRTTLSICGAERGRPPRRPAAAATRLPTRQRSARARSAALPSRASLQTELGGEIIDEREQDGAGGGEAVALGAALTGAASQLGGARRSVEQAPEG